MTRRRTRPSLLQDVARHCAARPLSVAVVDERGAADYGWLSARVHGIASRLRACAPVRATVEVRGRPSADYVAAVLAVLAVGGSVFLRHGMDRDHDPTDVVLTVRDALADSLALGAPLRNLCLTSIPHTSSPPGYGLQRQPDADAAYIVRSSGTTGRRKTIVGDYHALSHFLEWERARLRACHKDRVAMLSEVEFDVVFRDMFLPLVSGGTLVIPSAREATPSRVIPWLARTEISIIHAVPSLAAGWARLARDPPPLQRLRALLFAGEPLYGSVVSSWAQLLRPSCRIVNLYGPTETTLATCWYDVPTDAVEGLQPVGKLRPGAAVRVGALAALADESGTGEIVIETEHGCVGYAPSTHAASRRSLRTSPDGVTTFATGDRGHVDKHGDLHVTGRLDDQLKVRGKWVNLNDVVDALRQCTGVVDCAVVPRVNEGTTSLVVFIVSQLHASPDLANVRRRIAARCGGAAVPETFQWVTALPRLPTGKVDRQALAHRAATKRRSA